MRCFTLLALALGTAVAMVVGTTPAAPVPRPIPMSEQEQLLARGKRFAEQGKIDLLVALTAAWKLKADDLRQWQPAADFGRTLIERAGMKGGSKPQDSPSSEKDFATYLEHWKPTFKRMDEIYFRPDPDLAIPRIAFYHEAIQASGVVDPGGIACCLILSRGSVQATTGIQHSVVFANGNVTARTVMLSDVIVCDGNVTVAKEFVGQSVIVARGNIIAKRGISNIVLMAGGKVEYENKKTQKGKHLIVENKPNTLGVIFFELTTVGLEVKVVEKSVRVSAVVADKPAGTAGLKVGDSVLEVGGKKPADTETLRRLLRDALAVGDATVKVKRGNTTISVKMTLPE